MWLLTQVLVLQAAVFGFHGIVDMLPELLPIFVQIRWHRFGGTHISIESERLFSFLECSKK